MAGPSASSTVAVPRAARRPSGGLRGAAREQALVASGQLASGVGNLAFAVVMARLLEPAAFAQLAAFLALFLLIYLPARSISAGGALEPQIAIERRGQALRWGIASSALVLVVAVGAASTLHLSVALAVALATTPPLALLLALERGRLFGERAHGYLTASLAVEPAVRLGAGIVLALQFGTLGAAAGVVLGSVVALAVARFGGSARRAVASARERLGGGGSHSDGRAVQRSRAAVLSFLFLAVVQGQDVIFANATLPGGEAAQFAAISTIGGVAAFATTTIPLVMMPQARQRDPAALPAALGAALLLGAASVAIVAVAPDLSLGLAFGDRYVGLGELAVPYMGAMALLGVARVLAAEGAALGGRRVVAICGGVAAVQLGLLFALGDSTTGVVLATGIATAVLTTALGLSRAIGVRPAVEAPPAPSPPDLAAPEPVAPPAEEAPAPEAPAPEERPRRRGAALIVLGLMALAVAARLATDRSLWLDEATTWYEARLPFEAMLETLRTTDVHPPLHHVFVWLTVRGIGDAELALRLPSLVAGVAMIPMLFVTGRALFDRRTGLIAAALGTLSPIMVWYSEEARMYAQLMLFGVIAVWALHQAVTTGRARYWPAYALACAAMIWSHYFAVLPIAVLQVALVAMLWRRGRAGEPIRWAAAGATGATLAIVALVLPLIPFALDQFTANQAAGKGFDQPTAAGGTVDDNISLYGALANGIWAMWGYHSDATMAALAALWPLLMLGALLLLGRGRSRASALLVAVVVIPAALLTAIAVFHPFLFELRYNVTAVPMLTLLGARVISAWPATSLGRWALGGLAAATLAVGAADQQLNGANPRVYDFSGALARISDRANPGDLLLYQPAVLNNVISYYASGVDRRPLEGGVPAAPGSGAARRGEGAGTGAPPPRGVEDGHVFVLESFSDNPVNLRTTKQAVHELRRQRRQVDHFELPQVEVWEFR